MNAAFVHFPFTHHAMEIYATTPTPTPRASHLAEQEQAAKESDEEDAMLLAKTENALEVLGGAPNRPVTGFVEKPPTAMVARFPTTNTTGL